jgi:O-antigen ligase
MSNAQREISNRLAAAKWEKRPVLGIGTNAFDIAIRQEVSIPATFRTGIHGEFYRALYENGIVGLGLYMALWITAFATIALAWPMTKAAGDPGLNKIKLLCVTMFLIYCAFEASKGLTLACICALPFIVGLPPSALTAVLSATVTKSPFVPVRGQPLSW